MGALGAVYFRQKRYKDAIPLLERALPTWMRMREQTGNVIPKLLMAAYIAVEKKTEAVRTLREAGHDEAEISRRLEEARKIVR